MPETVSWSAEDTLALIDIWSDKNIQDQLEGAKRNEKVFQLIAESLTALGIHRTSKQCREKIKKLKHTYRIQKDNNSKSGAARKTDRYYGLLDSILGSRPSMRNDGVLDSSFSAPSTATQLLEAMVDDYDASSDTATSASSVPSPVPAASQQELSPATPESQDAPMTSTPAPPDPRNNPRGSILGKRRHQQSVQNEFLAYQKESDSAHLALLEAQHKQLLESRRADRETEAAEAAERLRVEETFNNQFINLFGQFVQVLREKRSQTATELP